MTQEPSSPGWFRQGTRLSLQGMDGHKARYRAHAEIRAAAWTLEEVPSFSTIP